MGMGMQLSSSQPTCSEQNLIRLVLPCGTVCDLSEAVSATEALQSHLISLTDASGISFNDYFMCDSVSLRVGERACPLHPDMQLKPGHLYYVLPIQTYQRPLTWSHISALADMAMAPATPSSVLPSSKTHVTAYCGKSPPSKIAKQCAMPRALLRIPGVKHYLCCRSVAKRRTRGNELHIASCHSYNKATLPTHTLVLDTESKKAEQTAELMKTEGSGSAGKFSSICDSSEANFKYVELLIKRSSTSWRPPLQTIQETLSV